MLAILFAIGVCLVALSHLTKKHASYAFPKALVVGGVAWLVSGLLFALGKFVIGIAFVALIVIAVILLIRKVVRSAP